MRLDIEIRRTCELLVTWHDDIANGRRLELRKEDQRPIGETWQVRALAIRVDGYTLSIAGPLAQPEITICEVLWTVGFSTQSGARDFFEKKVKEWHEGSGAR